MDTILSQSKIARQHHAHHSPQRCSMFCIPRVLPTSESPEALRMCGKRKRAHWKYECEQTFSKAGGLCTFPLLGRALACRHTCTTLTLPISSATPLSTQRWSPRVYKWTKTKTWKQAHGVGPCTSQMNLSGWPPVSLDWTEGRQRKPISPERYHVHLTTSKQNKFWCNYSWWKFV